MIPWQKLTVDSARKEVARIRKLAGDRSTQWEAENAERDLADTFIRWASNIKDTDAKEVRAIASEIALCLALCFTRNYATEDT